MTITLMLSEADLTVLVRLHDMSKKLDNLMADRLEAGLARDFDTRSRSRLADRRHVQIVTAIDALRRPVKKGKKKVKR